MFLTEFKVSKNIFDEVKNDSNFRLGFEAEFHVKNASDLLIDDEGYYPNDFETYSYYNNFEIQNKDSDISNNIMYEKETLFKLADLFSQFLGLHHGSISLEDSGYKTWKIMVDPSLYSSPNLLFDANNDIGVELVSPVMTLRDGLIWIDKIFNMIKTFRYKKISIYTTEMTGFHINLSYSDMNNFDFVKLAILGGDEHYLADFNRLKNRYSKPIIKAVEDSLSLAKQGYIEASNNALNLFKFTNWNSERVMADLSSLIPMDHHMSIDFRRLSSDNPYIELRMAGNRGYENRFDSIAQMIIRYATLIKIACDPNAMREEYLKKVYQLISNIIPIHQKSQQNLFPRIRVFLNPIMSSITRSALDKMESYSLKQTLTIPNAIMLFLQIVRSAIDLRQTNNLRIKQGLITLLSVLKITPNDILKSLKNIGMLYKFGVLRSQDKPMQAISVITNFIKKLNQPIGKFSENTANPYTSIIEEKTKPELSQYEKRRLFQKFEKMRNVNLLK